MNQSALMDFEAHFGYADRSSPPPVGAAILRHFFGGDR
jgi:hypothetical protein